jgi:hypothetical protein
LDRLLVTVAASLTEPNRAEVSPALLSHLGVKESEPAWLRFGRRRVMVRFFRQGRGAPGELCLSQALAAELGLPAPLDLGVYRGADREAVLGPLIGLLVSPLKAKGLKGGKPDVVYDRYAAFAREAGAVLVCFTGDDLDPKGSVSGFICRDGQWVEGRFPIPDVVYDRCFGESGREGAARVRSLAGQLGITVVNQLPKVTKLQAFGALRRYPELADRLPFTAPLTADALSVAMQAFGDLYLKPDNLYKGKGVHRLTRSKTGWQLHARQEQENMVWNLADRPDALRTMIQQLWAEAPYLLQEGLDLATYLGNRFDFRSLVQKDGQGRWTVSGLVARIAARGSVITSPRSGGEVAPAEVVLRHAFPDRWQAVLADLEGTSLLLADRIERELGLFAEFGLDIGVTASGAVKLIEVNGKPLRVSLERLNDPLISERINRCPIHYAVHLATQGGPA